VVLQGPPEAFCPASGTIGGVGTALRALLLFPPRLSGHGAEGGRTGALRGQGRARSVEDSPGIAQVPACQFSTREVTDPCVHPTAWLCACAKATDRDPLPGEAFPEADRREVVGDDDAGDGYEKPCVGVERPRQLKLKQEVGRIKTAKAFFPPGRR
jgi:hypothetical protein